MVRTDVLWWTDPSPRRGATSCPSTRSAASLRARVVDGCTALRSHRRATCWRMRVGLACRREVCCSQLTPGPPGHDSSLTIVYPSGPGAPPASVQTVRSPSLPYVALVFISETSLVAAGHDCAPVLFSGGPDGWALVRSLDDASAGGKSMTPNATGARAAGGPGRLNTEAFNRFRQADSRGHSAGGAGGSTAATAPGSTSTNAQGELLTVHQNTILDVQAYECAQDGSVTKIFTVGRDGRLCIWAL